jgi:hypothetical protein
VTTNELQPDVDEVLQVEEPAGVEPVVRVEQQGPVRTQSLPRKAGATRTITVNALPTPYRLLTANPRRAQATIIADLPIRVALNAAAAQDEGTMALWPGLVPLTVMATTEVWVAAETGTASVSVVSEFWATGEGGE